MSKAKQWRRSGHSNDSRSKVAFFTKDQIPASLLRRLTDRETGDWALILPPQLVQVYQEMLNSLGLRGEAENQLPNDEGPQGGKTKAETHKHFGRSFSGSAARVQLVFLDPTAQFKTTRDVLVRLFSGGRLHLLDVPCGCGASSALLLCLVAELRREGVLPKIPLHVHVSGWDISASARLLKRDLFRRLKSLLIHDGILVKTRIQKWDVTDEEQNSERTRGWVKAIPSGEPVGVIAANFSGFLHSKVKECKGQLREMLRYARHERATVLWIEPQTKQALDRLFPDLIKHVLKEPFKLQVCWANKKAPRKAEHTTLHPVQRNGRFQTRASALHLTSGGQL